MFEMSEIRVLGGQFNAHLKGKKISSGSLGNSPHKFVWYNRTHGEFSQLTKGRTIGLSKALGRWLLVDLEPGYCLVLGEIGGKLLWHRPGEAIPDKYHLLLNFEDGDALSLKVQMWGGIELYEKGSEMQCKYIRGMAPTPADANFTLDYFLALVENCVAKGPRSVKSLLTQEQTIPGLGNSVAQDIMFKARLHPRQELSLLSLAELKTLFKSIVNVVREVTEAGGRDDETDLFGQQGKYRRLMHSKAAGQPCPVCQATVQKIQYLGGACYFCPSCQALRKN